MGTSPVQYRYADAVTLRASAALGATAVGATVAAGEHGTVRLTLAVTAVSGTSPTLDCVVETSQDGTTWRSLGSFAQKTIVATERKSFSGVDHFIRINNTIGGSATPTVTFSVVGSGV